MAARSSSDGTLPMRKEEPKVSGTIQLMLALYLILFAFFIVLVSISTLEEVKVKQANTSIFDAFHAALPLQPRGGGDDTGYRVIPLSAAFTESLATLFATKIKLVRIREKQVGRLMTLSVPTEELFVSDALEIVPEKHELLEQMAGEIARVKRGMRFEIEILSCIEAPKNDTFSTSETLAVRRAIRLAKETVKRGVAAYNVRAGIQICSKPETLFTFRAVPLDEKKLEFDAAITQTNP